MGAIQGGDGHNKAEGATSKAKIWITNMEISQFFNFKLIFFWLFRKETTFFSIFENGR